MGWSKVDVILRRVDDSFCDPLELRSDSLLGVPGLVDAIVAGNVKVANALGSGVIETAAVMPFLPGLSQAFAWREAQTSVRRDLVVRAGVRARLGAQSSGFRRGEAGVSITGHGAGLRSRTPAGRKEQVCAINCGPGLMSMWRKNRSLCPLRPCGTTATLTRAAWCCAPMCSIPAMGGLRSREDWCALPKRKARSSRCSAAATARTRGCCGTAQSIRSACCVRAMSRWSCAACSRAVPSSVADNVFWLGRYVERAENIARILRAMISRVRRADEAESRVPAPPAQLPRVAPQQAAKGQRTSGRDFA